MTNPGQEAQRIIYVILSKYDPVIWDGQGREVLCRLLVPGEVDKAISFKVPLKRLLFFVIEIMTWLVFCQCVLLLMRPR